MTDEPKPTARDYFKDFPEAPASDTFKWIDRRGVERMTTIRSWSPESLRQAVDRFLDEEFANGGVAQRPLNQIPQPADSIPATDENGTPIVDGNTGQPQTTKLPDGVRLYTVAALVHDQNKDKTKDILKVFTVEEPYNKGYGVACFHPPAALKGFASWPLTSKQNKNQFAPPEGCKHVLIRDPQGESKYPDVTEFRA